MEESPGTEKSAPPDPESEDRVSLPSHDGERSGVRTWFQHNEVFFRAGAATLLAAMAIVVSVLQLNIAADQKRIAQAQLDLARHAQSPQFFVSAELADGTWSTATEDRLLVRNLGQPVQSVVCEWAVLFEFLGCCTTETQGEEPRRSIVEGYYTGTAYASSSQGLVAEIRGTGNHRQRREIESSYRDAFSDRGDTPRINVLRYVHIHYVDAFGDAQDRLYYVPLLGAGALELAWEANSEFMLGISRQLEEGTFIELRDLAQLTAEAWPSYLGLPRGTE